MQGIPVVQWTGRYDFFSTLPFYNKFQFVYIS